MSNEKGTIITAITSDVIEDPFLMIKLTKPKLVGVWQDLLQIEYKLKKEGI